MKLCKIQYNFTENKEEFKMKKVKLAIIGCGGIANGKHMPSLKKLDTVEMVAFCDIVRERAEEAAEKYGVEGARVYEDYNEMLAKEELDVVHVCTPNNVHAPASIAAMEAGCHVMCEKPMAKTVAEAQAMLDAQKKTGKKLTIGYQNRFTAENRYLHEACENGDLGEIYYAEAEALRRRAVPTWGVFLDKEAQGGGPLIDIGTHALDMTLWHMNNYEVKSVKGSVFEKLRNQTRTGNAWGDWDPEKYTAEDSAFGFVTMKNGATIIVKSSWAINIADAREAMCVLAGTKAGADCHDGLRINKVQYGRQVIEKVACGAGGVAFYDGSAETPSDLEAAQWIDAVINDKEPLVKPEQAFVVTQILEAIYESAKTGKEIIF